MPNQIAIDRPGSRLCASGRHARRCRPPGLKPGRQRVTLAAAGAGIAATFGTPIGAVIMAIALMQPYAVLGAVIGVASAAFSRGFTSPMKSSAKWKFPICAARV
jgi:H+/Cl- antiporter ClcA